MKKLTLAVLCIALIFIFYVNTQVIFYVDDYFYATFFMNGFRGFIEQNIWHYQNFNGRVFVHVMAQATLFFGTTLFPLVNLGFLILICLIAHKLQNSSNAYIFTAFFLATIMLLDVSILSQSYLWASASFNYTLSTAMLPVSLYMCKLYAQTGKLKWYMPVLLFLAGATTEQLGPTSAFAILLFVVAFKKSVPLLLPCIMGIITIFLSGATFGRLEVENYSITSGTLDSQFIILILRRFSELSLAMYQANFGIIFVLFGVLVGLVYPKYRAGFVYSAVILVLLFLPIPRIHLVISVLSMIFIALVGFVFIKNKKHAYSGILILSALFSLLIMLLTNTLYPRVVFPFILIIIAVCANLASIAIMPKRLNIAMPVYVVACCIFFIPLVLGYRSNRIVMESTISSIVSARATGSNVYFNMDFSDSHRHTLPHDCGLAYQTFRNFHRLDDDITVYFVSDITPPIYTHQGVMLRMHAQYIDNRLFMPFSQVVTALGGWYEWHPPYTLLHLNGTDYKVYNHNYMIVFTRNGEEQYYYMRYNTVLTVFTLWPADYIAKIFDITYEYVGGRYVITPGVADAHC